MPVARCAARRARQRQGRHLAEADRRRRRDSSKTMPARTCCPTSTATSAAWVACCACKACISIVRDESGAMFQCATRRLLKTLATDQRHVVAAGDVVWFRPEGESEGIIERVEPRRGVVSRTSRGRQHVLVANVDQLVIVTSAAEPRLKPNLIDRLLVTAEKGGIRPVICINKIDLIEPADLMPLVGVYAQLGYDVLLVSAATGIGIDRLRERLAGAAKRRDRAERRRQVVAAQRGRAGP